MWNYLYDIHSSYNKHSEYVYVYSIMSATVLIQHIFHLSIIGLPVCDLMFVQVAHAARNLSRKVMQFVVIEYVFQRIVDGCGSAVMTVRHRAIIHNRQSTAAGASHVLAEHRVHGCRVFGSMPWYGPTRVHLR